MSNKKTRRQQKNRRTTPPGGGGQQRPGSQQGKNLLPGERIIAKAKAEADSALEVAVERNIEPDRLEVVALSQTTELTPDKLTALFDELQQAKAIYVEAAAAAQREIESLDSTGAQLAAREQAIASQESELLERSQELQREEAALAESRTLADETATSLFEREIAVEARESQTLAEVTAKAQGDVLGPLFEMRADLLAAPTERIAGLLASAEERMAEAERAERLLAAREGKLAQAERMLEEERAALEADLADSVADATMLLRQRLDDQTQLRRRLERELQDRQQQDSALEELQRLTGGSAQSVAERLHGLRSRIDELEVQLSGRPETDVLAKLEAESAARARFEDMVASLQDELVNARAEVSAARLAVLERDRLDRTVEVMSAEVNAYTAEIERLTRNYEGLNSTGGSDVPFPECLAMDTKTELQLRPTTLRDQPVDLGQLTDYLQWALKYQRPPGSPGLNFALDDLRVFIAGLAMSRLHILEGVSGTGKTSLPIAAAEVLGGGFAKIEVQAGWRDSQDLIGFYNEFEGRFREHEFTRSLYRAMTPRYAEGIFFVVLDEMNLSKPEQYFADYLSKLEDLEGADATGRGMVTLVPRSFSSGLPQRLVPLEDGGVGLPLNDNVWFIGTANHDETTASFAPKTQSRAHVMELPRQPPSDSEMGIGPEPVKSANGGVRFERLREAFGQAAQSRQAQAEQAVDFFGATMSRLDDIDDDLTWGPRLARQVRRFVPVVVESGGTLDLAVDHLLYTKLVRRMRDRYTIDDRARREILGALQTNWPSGERAFENSKSARELHRQMGDRS